MKRNYYKSGRKHRRRWLECVAQYSD